MEVTMAWQNMPLLKMTGQAPQEIARQQTMYCSKHSLLWDVDILDVTFHDEVRLKDGSSGVVLQIKSLQAAAGVVCCILLITFRFSTKILIIFLTSFSPNMCRVSFVQSWEEMTGLSQCSLGLEKILLMPSQKVLPWLDKKKPESVFCNPLFLLHLYWRNFPFLWLACPRYKSDICYKLRQDAKVSCYSSFYAKLESSLMCLSPKYISQSQFVLNND